MISVWLQHVNSEPALCIGRQQFGFKGAYVVCLSAAWEYNEPERMMRKAFEAAKALNMYPPSKGEAMMLIDIFQNGLDALVNMAPENDEDERRRERIESGVKGEGVLTLDGKTYEFEI